LKVINPSAFLTRLSGEKAVPQWRQGLLNILILAALTAALLVPRVIGLGRFVTPDEPLWGKRSGSFYYAIQNREFAGTYQTGHPGVMAMWAGALAYQRVFPEFKEYGQIELGDAKVLEIFQRHGINPMEILTTARLNMILFATIALLLSFHFARRMFGLLPAAVTLLVIAFDPFQVAHTRVLHHFGLLSCLTFLAVLAYLDFLRSHSRVSLIISAAAGGLSILTVAPGIVLIPVIGLLSLSGLYDAEKKKLVLNWKRLWRNTLSPALIWGSLAFLTVFAAWPSMWVDSLGTMQRVAAYALSAGEGEIGGTHFVESFQAGPDDGTLYLHYYPLTYLWRSTPATLFGLVLFVAVLLRERRSNRIQREVKLVLLGLMVFVLAYLTLMSIGEKKFDRYLLPVYPPLSLLATLGWIWASETASHRLQFKKVLPAAILSLVFIVQIVSSVRTAPYYLTYFNPLFGGLEKAPQVLMVGWGEGLNEAALYLKDDPDIRKKRIISWYPLAFNWYSFNLGFQAEHAEFSWDNTPETYQDFDYAVLYINQIQRNIPPALMNVLLPLEPEHSVSIDGVEFVRIYRLNNPTASEN